jgi:hypothetical protein
VPPNYFKRNLTASIESITSLGAVVISFSDSIDAKRLKIKDIDSAAMKICVKARNNISPFGDLCGTSVDDKPTKRELVAVNKRCLITEEFCDVEYTQPKDFTWKVEHLEAKKLHLLLDFHTPGAISPDK